MPWASLADKTAGLSTDVRIYTDGAYSSKLDAGGWAFVVAGSNTFKVRGKGSGGAENTTNNRMELMAIIEAIKYALKNFRDENVIIVSDSQYAIRCASVLLPKQGQGSFGIARAAIKNVDLVEELQRVLAQHISVDFEWVRGHDGDVWNITADRLAVRARGTFVNQRDRRKRLAPK